jgi:hypothetical protein
VGRVVEPRGRAEGRHDGENDEHEQEVLRARGPCCNRDFPGGKCSPLRSPPVFNNSSSLVGPHG